MISRGANYSHFFFVTRFILFIIVFIYCIFALTVVDRRRDISAKKKEIISAMSGEANWRRISIGICKIVINDAPNIWQCLAFNQYKAHRALCERTETTRVDVNYVCDIKFKKKKPSVHCILNFFARAWNYLISKMNEAKRVIHVASFHCEQ